MNLGKITVITPPDRIFNLTMSFLLVKPSATIKKQIRSIFNGTIDNINIFVYDTNDNDVSWLLSVADQASSVIIDIDNCDQITKQFVSYMIAHPHVHYITSDEITPYNLISNNRIYDLSEIIEKIDNANDTGEEEHD